MVLEPPTERGRRTREKIIRAAAELFRAAGVRATSIDDVLERSGCGKSQLYHYFSGKDELVAAVLESTMIDSDDVLLLRPPRPAGPDHLGHVGRAVNGRRDYLPFRRSGGQFFCRLLRAANGAVLEETGARLLGHLETEPAENTFPQLPVREGENVFVWLASFDSPEAYRAYLDRLDQHEKRSAEILPQLNKRLTTTPQQLRLLPIPNSRLR